MTEALDAIVNAMLAEWRQQGTLFEWSPGETDPRQVNMNTGETVDLEKVARAGLAAHCGSGVAPDPPEDLVEKVARKIDPSSWRVMDSELVRVKRIPNAGYDPDNFKDRRSMVLARTIIALVRETDAVQEEVEGSTGTTHAKVASQVLSASHNAEPTVWVLSHPERVGSLRLTMRAESLADWREKGWIMLPSHEDPNP